MIRAADLLKRLESGFATELLEQAERRAYRDPALAARVADAGARFNDLALRLAPIEKRLCRLIDCEPKPDEDERGAGAPRATSSPAPGPDRCSDRLSTGACVAIIVIVVVIVVVAGAAK